MSTDLKWRPAPKDVPAEQWLPYELKKALSQRYWGHDGSIHGDEITLDGADLPYLEGLVDGQVTGADELVAAIREHRRVIVWIN